MDEEKDNGGKSVWTHLVFEAYCSFGWGIETEFIYQIVDFDTFETKKIPNKNYDPDKVLEKRPEFCPKEPCTKCWENDCKWLCLTPADDDDYKIMMKAWWKKHNKGDE